MVCASSSQDYLTRHLLMTLPVSECPYSENFLRTVVFSPESSVSIKYGWVALGRHALVFPVEMSQSSDAVKQKVCFVTRAAALDPVALPRQ